MSYSFNNKISKVIVAIFVLFGFLSYTKNISLIGNFILLFTFVTFIYCLVLRKPHTFTNFIFIIIPLISIYRDFSVAYGFPSYLLIANIFLFLVINPTLLKLKNKSSMMAIIFISIYVFIGIVSGKKIDIFIKHIELILAIYVFTIYLKYYKVNLLYYCLLLVILCFSLFQFIETRFIVESSTSYFKVDPSLLGNMLILPMTYFISSKKSDKIEFNKKYVNLFLIFTIICLIFTTSRTGIFVFLITILFVSKYESYKKTLTLFIFLFIILFLVYYFTSINEIIDLWYNKTFNHDKGISGSSTGRFDQWHMTYNYILDSDFFSLFFGFGPANGYDFSGIYSKTIPITYLFYGKQIQLHSLYLNIFVEYGLLAFTAFSFWLIKCFKVVKFHRIKYDDNFYSLLLIAFLFLSLGASSTSIIHGFMIALFLTPNYYYERN
ncbi:O-antigen ligase family protein [Flavobacteriaceae bacterium]|nr:O-antigen ligase family protein [Flavobacteriaceae bacterium]